MVSMGSTKRTRLQETAWATVIFGSLLFASCVSGKPRAEPPSTTSTTSTTKTSTTVPQSTTASSGTDSNNLPATFSAASVTFVSLRTGWVLGTAPCPTPPCTRLFRTSDGGQTWVSIPAPPAPLSEEHETGVREIRFANLSDGWAYQPDLWATHDGGAHWAQQSIGQVLALETAAGVVHAVGGPDNEANAFTIRTSPVHSDGWRQSDTTVPSGAGPVAQVNLVLHGDTGWLVGIDRTVTGGARLEGGRWVPWQPPCTDTGGGVMLAAPPPADVG